MTVVKGGDQQQIAYNQRLGIVDIRLEFAGLFTSLYHSTKTENRTTLKEYLKVLTEEREKDEITTSLARRKRAETVKTATNYSTRVSTQNLAASSYLRNYYTRG